MSWYFSMTHGIVGSDNSEFSDVNFCLVLQNNNLTFTFAYGTMLRSENSE